MRRLHDDAGSTMVVVLIVMLVLSIGGLALAAVVTNTTIGLAHSRDTAQSRAAADAGLAAAIVQARQTKSICASPSPTPSLYATSAAGSQPEYSVTVTCEEGGHLVFSSRGTGADGAVTVTQAVFEYSVDMISYGSSDMYFYGETTFSSGTLTHALNGDLLSIVIPFGGFTCNAAVPANIVVSGNIKTQGNCNVEGSVVAGGTINMSNNSDTVRGNLIASGAASSVVRGTVGGRLQTGGALSFSGGNKTIGGSVIAGGAVVLDGEKIAGSLTLPPAASLNPTNPTTAQVAKGVIRQAIAPPVLPQMPAWYDYAFDESDWDSFSGEQFADPVVLSTNNVDPAKRCSYFTSWPNAGWTALSNLTTPTIIDARACGTFTSQNGGNPVATLKTSVAILANSFDLGNLTIKAATGASPNLWFLTDDRVQDGAPTCSSGQGGLSINGTVITSPVRAMVYTPCSIDVQGQNIDTWNGNFYSQSFQYGGTFNFTGDPISIPGLEEASVVTGTTQTLGSLISQRDVK